MDASKLRRLVRLWHPRRHAADCLATGGFGQIDLALRQRLTRVAEGAIEKVRRDCCKGITLAV